MVAMQVYARNRFGTFQKTKGVLGSLDLPKMANPLGKQGGGLKWDKWDQIEKDDVSCLAFWKSCSMP